MPQTHQSNYNPLLYFLRVKEAVKINDKSRYVSKHHNSTTICYVALQLPSTSGINESQTLSASIEKNYNLQKCKILKTSVLIGCFCMTGRTCVTKQLHARTEVDLTSKVVIKPLLKNKIDKLSHDIMVHLITDGAVPLVSVCVAGRR